jgi:hypothetical protein
MFNHVHFHYIHHSVQLDYCSLPVFWLLILPLFDCMLFHRYFSSMVIIMVTVWNIF